MIKKKKIYKYFEIKTNENYNIFKVPFNIFDFFFKDFLKRRKTNKFNYLINRISYLIESRVISFFKKIAKILSLSLLWGILQDPFGWKLLLKLLITQTQNIDLIFTTPIPKSCVTASLIAARIKRIPIIITPAYHFMLKDYFSNDKLWVKILRKFNLITTYTYTESDYLNNIGIPKKRLKTIGIGVPFHEINLAGPGNWREKLKIPKNQFTVLYINPSIANLYKGIETVIKAAIKLSSISFIFVGKTRADWENLLEKHNLQESKNIYYIELVHGKEKNELFNAIDLVVRPSIDDAFGLVYFEGMSAGKPIITSNIDAMIEVSKDVGLSIPFGNVTELIKAITRLKNDKELYQKLSKNALNKSLSYSWENLAKKFEETFLSLIEGKKKK